MSTQYRAILCSSSFVDEILQTVIWQIIVQENLVSFSYFLRVFYLRFKNDEFKNNAITKFMNEETRTKTMRRFTVKLRGTLLPVES